MKTLFKWTHLIIMAGFVITGSDVYDYILTGIIATIAYIYAYTFTRRMSDDLDYNSTMMSFVHWAFRTFISVVMILITRFFFVIVKEVFATSNGTASELLAVAVCSLAWIIIAETLKAVTGLNRNYW